VLDIFGLAELARPSARRELSRHVGQPSVLADVDRDLLEAGFRAVGFARLVSERGEGRDEGGEGLFALSSFGPVRGLVRPPPPRRVARSPPYAVVEQIRRARLPVAVRHEPRESPLDMLRHLHVASPPAPLGHDRLGCEPLEKRVDDRVERDPRSRHSVAPVVLLDVLARHQTTLVADIVFDAPRCVEQEGTTIQLAFELRF
jgi:hypothetical protein